MPKELIISRKLHILLDRITNMGAIGGNDVERLAMYGLVSPINHENGSCSYKGNDAGKKYLADHPAMPPFKMSLAQAAEVYRILGDEEWECLDAHKLKTSIINQLIEIRGIEFVADEQSLFTRYVGGELVRGRFAITQDGIDSFNKTYIGEKRLAKIMNNENRQKMVDKFWKSARGKRAAKLAPSLQLLALRDLALENEDAEYANDLLRQSHRADTKEKLDAALGENSYRIKFDSEDRPIEISGFESGFTVERQPWHNLSVNVLGIWSVRCWVNLISYYSRSAHDERVQMFIDAASTALAVSQKLNDAFGERNEPHKPA